MADLLGRPVTLAGVLDVLAAQRAEDFPMDKQALAYSVGEIEIRDRAGRSVPVRRVLDVMRDEHFASADDAVRAICEAADRAADHDASAAAEARGTTSAAARAGERARRHDES